MWTNLRLEYLLITFAIALATMSIFQDIMAALWSERFPGLLSGGSGLFFTYGVSISVTVTHAIAKAIRDKKVGID